ncbi:MAG TPA: phenylalanine--tRNA ligase subunit beta [Methanomassiliicoccales archaeon]|nr:phenylalanine--tRNA ligase subunit beta [Methanomassiliicoccales archaeon]
MPVITFGYRDLIGLLGREVPAEELIGLIPMMGADFHHFDPATGELGVEFFPDRPDNFSVEGVARSLRAFLGIEPGLRRYHVSESGITLKVERSVEGVRPYVVAGVVRDVRMTDELIRSLMELQEKVHLTVGRKRQKVSVGIHDMDAVRPPFVYKAVDPESISFVPLAKEVSMNLREILQRHEKGIDYAYILEGKSKYPIILDADGRVLSFPPIINGKLTTVTESTRNIFIDVTGTDMNAISGVLNIVATAMSERGARMQSVKVEGRRKMTTPHLHPEEWSLSVRYANQWLGLGLSPEEMSSCLGRMGFDARPEKGRLKVLVPATRMDILHPVDLVEDVAIGYGYARFGAKLPEVHSIGSERPIERTADLVRQMMVGHGYYEVTTLTLSSRREQFDAVLLPPCEVVEVLNPITEDHDCLRISLLPSLLAVLRKSKHRDLPQRVFEVGDVVIETRRRKHLAAVSIHSKASFTEVKSLAEGVMHDLAHEFEIEPCDLPSYIPGRAAFILVEGQRAGHFGELHPQVMLNFELGYPVAAMELDLDAAMKGRMLRLV